MERKGSTLLFHNLEVVRENEPSPFKAEEMAVHWDFSWLKRTFYLTAELETPQIYFENCKLHLWKGEERSYFNFIKKELSLKIDKGAFFLPCGKMAVDLSVSWGEEKRLLLSLAEGDQSFDLNYDKNSDEESLFLKASHFPLPGVSELLERLLSRFRLGRIEEGIMEGTLAVSQVGALRPQVVSDLKVYDFRMEGGDLGFTIEAPELTLRLQETPLQPKDPLFPSLPHLLGEIALSKESSLSWGRYSSRPFHAKGVTGSFLFSEGAKAEGFFKGIEEYVGYPAPFTSSLSFEYETLDKATFSLGYASENSDRTPATLEVRGFDIGSGESQLLLDLKNMGSQQFTLLEAILKKIAPGVNPLHYQRGRVNAKAKASLVDHKIAELSVEQISLKYLKSHAAPWDSDFGAESVEGFFKIDLQQPKPLDTLDAELSILNGFVKLNYQESELWTFTDIQTNLVIKKGEIQNSVASVNLAGLTGRAEMSWQSQNSPLSMHFEGKGGDLALFMPQPLQMGMKKASSADEIVLDVGMKKEGSALRFRGHAKIVEPEGGETQAVNFGFDLLSPSATTAEEGTTLWVDVNSQLFPHSSTEFFRSPTNLGVLGFKVAYGWISAKDVNLEKFVSPYLFKKGEMKLRGRADLSALFDLRGLELAYTAQELLLENEKVRILVGGKEAPLKGQHWLDFRSGGHRGRLPFAEGSYYDKTKDLLFQETQGVVEFDNKKIFIKELVAVSNGLDLQGNVLVDLTDPREGVFDVIVHAETIEGDLKSVGALLSKIDANLLLSKIPLEGQVQLSRKGADFVFNIFPEDFEWDVKVQGSLSDGKMTSTDTPVSPQSLGLNFEYDKAGDKFLLSDIAGVLVFESAPELEPLHFFIDKLGFDRFTKREGNFHFKLWDPHHEILALKGSTAGNEEEISFFIDESASHILGIHPDLIELKTQSKGDIGLFSLDFRVNIPKFIKEFKKLSFSKVFISEELYEPLATLMGSANFQFRYHADDQLLNMGIVGDKIAFGEKKFQEVHLNGVVSRGIWKINEAVIDEISFAADLSKKENLWLFDHVSLKKGESLIMGFEGEWEAGSSLMKARVHLLEISLDHLNEYDELRPFFDEFEPKGTLMGSGAVTVSKNQEGGQEAGWGLEASLTTHFKNIEFKGLHFRDLEPSTLQFSWEKGIQFRNMKSALIDPADCQNWVDLFVEKIEIDFISDQIEVDNLTYSLPASKLGWLADKFKATFPDLVTPFVKESVSGLKHQGNVEGSFTLRFKADETEVIASLADGKWHFFGWEADLKDFTLEMNRDEVKVATQYKLDQESVWILARTPRPNFSSGVVVIADTEIQEDEREPLTLYWEKTEKEGLVVKKAQGSVLGLYLALNEDEASPSDLKWLNLKGEAHLDLRRASALLPEAFGAKVKAFEMGNGWGLRGRLQFEKSAEGEDRVWRYEGELHGEQFDIKGYRFDRLFGHVVATDRFIWLNELSLEDAAGSASLPRALFEKDHEGRWIANIPEIKVRDLRPSLLWELPTARPQTAKPLVIRELTVQNLYGPLDPLSDLTGRGSLHFVNPAKKNLQNTIFAIPGEIVSRIGIDLVALSPVTGTINFEIEDEKVVFTKFKDVYSDGKLSKFFLSSDYPSYMDFDTRLNVHIKMKQYTLLFKLAELFTFNIEGTLSKPTYSLKKGS